MSPLSHVVKKTVDHSGTTFYPGVRASVSPTARRANSNCQISFRYGVWFYSQEKYYICNICFESTGKKKEYRMRKMGVAEKYVSVVQDVFKAGWGGFESFNYLFLPW